MKHKILCTVISLALLTVLLSVGVSAADETNTVHEVNDSTSFANAITAVNTNGGGTITLTASFQCTGVDLELTKSTTVDLNGYMLQGVSGSTLTVSGEGTILTITNTADHSETQKCFFLMSNLTIINGAQVIVSGESTEANKWSIGRHTDARNQLVDVTINSGGTLTYNTNAHFYGGTVTVGQWIDDSGKNTGTLEITKEAVNAMDFGEIVKWPLGNIELADGCALARLSDGNYKSIPPSELGFTNNPKTWKTVKYISIPTVTLTTSNTDNSTAIAYQYGEAAGTLTVGVTNPPENATGFGYKLWVYPQDSASSLSDAKSITLTGDENGASLDMSTWDVLQALVASKGNTSGNFVYKCECVVTYTVGDTTCSVTTAPIDITVEKRVVKLVVEPKNPISKIYDGIDGGVGVGVDPNTWVSENLLIYAVDADTDARIDKLSLDNGTVFWQGSLKFNSKNVAEATTLTISGLTFNSSTALNYVLADNAASVSVPAKITPIIATPENVGDFGLTILGSGGDWKMETVPYTGLPLTPEAELVYSGESFLVRGDDYKVVYENNVDIGTATVTVTEGTSGNFKLADGVSITTNFLIINNHVIVQPKSLSVEVGSAPPVLELVFEGLSDELVAEILGGYTPVFKVTDASDIVVSLEDAVKSVGTYKVEWDVTQEKIAELMGDKITPNIYPGTLTVTKKSIAVPAADTAVYTYNGQAQTYPIAENDAYTVTGNTQTGANETGYTVTVALKDTANTQWSDGSVTDKTYTFVIKKATVTVAALDRESHTGDTTPGLSAPTEGTDYTVTGLVGNDKLNGTITMKYQDANGADVASPTAAGSYTIVIGGATAPNDANYNAVVYTNGTLKILQQSTDDGIQPKPELGPWILPFIPRPKPQPQPQTDLSGGWNQIRDELRDTADKIDRGILPPGASITVTMNGVSEVPESVLQAIAGRDVSICFDMGNGIRWSLSGLDVSARPGKLDLGIAQGGDFVPLYVVNPITGERQTRQISLSHNGPFGTTLQLSLNLGGENRGFWANLYYYDEAMKTLVFRHASRIRADGEASWPFDHASSYVVVIDSENRDPSWVNPFSDVTESDWFYADVAYVSRNQLMSDTGAGSFDPALPATRGMIVTVLYRLEGEPAVPASPNSFTDLRQDWYKDAVRWAAAHGIVDGYGDGRFGPDDPITREQTVTVLWRYARYKNCDVSIGENTNILSYRDAPEIAEYAIPAMQWGCGTKILEGEGGYLTPTGPAKRSEIAAMLHRFCTLQKKP